jgi:hypothetical protein
MSTLRIRPDNGTIRELKIPKGILEVLQKVVTSPQTTDDVKKTDDKEICTSIPVLHLQWDSIARGCVRCRIC